MKKIFVLIVIGTLCNMSAFSQQTKKYLVTDSTNWNISLNNFPSKSPNTAKNITGDILVIIDDKLYSTHSPEFLQLKKEVIKESKIIKSTDAALPVQGAIIITTVHKRN